jgi:hypothetical protein
LDFSKTLQIHYIAVQGCYEWIVDHYNLNSEFRANTPTYQNTFPLYNYSDTKKEGMGVLIANNDLKLSTTQVLNCLRRI